MKSRVTISYGLTQPFRIVAKLCIPMIVPLQFHNLEAVETEVETRNLVLPTGRGFFV